MQTPLWLCSDIACTRSPTWPHRRQRQTGAWRSSDAHSAPPPAGDGHSSPCARRPVSAGGHQPTVRDGLGARRRWALSAALRPAGASLAQRKGKQGEVPRPRWAVADGCGELAAATAKVSRRMPTGWPSCPTEAGPPPPPLGEAESATARAAPPKQPAAITAARYRVCYEPVTPRPEVPLRRSLQAPYRCLLTSVLRD